MVNRLKIPTTVYRSSGQIASTLAIVAVLIGAILVGGGLGIWGLTELAKTRPTLQRQLDEVANWFKGFGLTPASDSNLRLSPGVSEGDIATRYGQFVSANSLMNTTEAADWLLLHAPGLSPLIRLHAAKRLAALPDEASAQLYLSPVVDSDSPWAAQGLYQLGQSHLRASMKDDAQRTFNRLKDTYPTSDEAIGSLYYLSQLAPSLAESANAATQYLRLAPTGRFAEGLADTLIQHTPLTSLTADQRSDLALAYNHTANTAKLEAVVASGNLHPWVAALVNHPAESVTTATGNAFRQAPHRPLSEEEFTLLLRRARQHLTTHQQVAAYTAGVATFPAQAAQLLWESGQTLQRANQPTGATLTALINDYPDSDYTPAAQAQLIWQDWPAATASPSSEAASRFIRSSNHFIKRYPYASDAAMLVFWQGKLAEKAGKPNEAKKHYQHAVTHYPVSYYGTRSQQRLNALTGGEDQQWTLPPTTAWPSPPNNNQTISGGGLESPLPLTLPLTLPSPKVLKNLDDWQHLPDNAASMVATLLAMAQQSPTHALPLLDDAHTVLTTYGIDDNNMVAAITGATIANMADGDMWRGVRRIHDAVKGLARHKHMAAYQPNSAWDPLLYPVLYQPELTKRGRITGVPAMLGLSLMREESFFNPKAVSSSNALGLMQLLPTTAAEVAGWEGVAFTPNDLFTPQTNIHLGMRYLQYLQQRFSSSGLSPATYPALMVGAYNGGPNAMAGWATASPHLPTDPDLFVESIPYEQTRLYIKKVYTSLWHYQQEATS